MTQRSPFQRLLHEGITESATPFSGWFDFTLDPYHKVLSANKATSSTISWVFGMTRPGIEPWSPGPLSNTLLITLVGFNCISTSIGCLIPEPFYIYIIYMVRKYKCFGWWWLGFMANWPLKGYWVLNSAIVSILLYGCTTWTLTKRLEKKLDANYTRILRAILSNSWTQNPTKNQLYGHLPPITKTIQTRRTRHAGHCWRSRDEIISHVFLLTPTYGRAKAGRPARTYIQQLCEDTGCSPEDLPATMNDREKWRERVRDIRAGGTTWWWWWWWCVCAYISVKAFCLYKLDGRRCW